MEQSIVIQNIIALLKEQRKTQKNLTDYLGITQNAFTDWKSGRIKSYTKHLPQIADYFGVSVDYLLGNESADKKESLTEPKLSEGEKELIDLFRQLPIESQKMYLEVLRASLRR